jgi:GH24 family phage-related lysozyme (muramidase)
VYNIGEGAFLTSNAYKLLKVGNKAAFVYEAFDEKNGFVKQKGKTLRGLVKRRARERQIFLDGIYKKS